MIMYKIYTAETLIRTCQFVVCIISKILLCIELCIIDNAINSKRIKENSSVRCSHYVV